MQADWVLTWLCGPSWCSVCPACLQELDGVVAVGI